MITTETKISSLVDWLSLTVDTPIYHRKLTMRAVELERGMMGYTAGIRFLDGRMELVNPERPEMRTHLIYTGDVLAGLFADYGVTSHDIMTLSSPGERVSRIDIAIDIKEGSLDIDMLASDAQEKRMVSTAKTAYQIKTLTGKGQTLYIGSPKSKVRARIYDKAAEQGIDGDWTRIELQIRGKKADYVKYKLQAGTAKLEAIPALIKGFVNFPGNADYNIATGEKVLNMRAAKRPDTSTEKWLLTTVVGSLARIVARDEPGTFLSRFTNALEAKVVEETGRVKTHGNRSD